MRRPVMLFVLLMVLLVSGCALRQTPSAAPGAQSASTTPRPTDVPSAPTGTTRPPTALPSPTSTATPPPTVEPSATPVPTPTMHPFMIAAMRELEYPGSAITIEGEFDRGANYARYDASYRSEGLKVYALLTIPDGEPPAGGWPGVVFVHGHIPPDQYRTGERYKAYVDRIARAGFVVLMPDLRGHHRSEGLAVSGNRDGAYTIDALNAVAALQAHPQVDAERIGMWGHSMGGGITLRSMVISSQIKAGVIWAGVVAPYPAPVQRWPRPIEGAVDTAEFWAAVSPNSFLADLSGPLQLHHGTADDSVPIAWSEELVEQLEAVGWRYEYWIYDGNDHNLSKSIPLAMDRSVAFFDRWVKGE